ncbi:MAG: hypothetical protein LBV41_08150 [Cytophagaceae bacterium]|jgi:hypothetical protein|nr:hypothetical protein [Cytophagaceae bacterium]
MNTKAIFAVLFIVLCNAACRNDDVIIPSEKEPVAPPDTTVTTPDEPQLTGFYLLNEGNMGTNKASLDFMNFKTGVYHRNIYDEANPSAPKGLGDVGNDLQIYGSKLYAVINLSNKVEVMDKHTAHRLGQIDIPNCRYIAFHEGYAYVTSYAGPVTFDPDLMQIGYVAKVDTATFEVIEQCLVGYQPDELAIVGNKLYVANSGGYMIGNYENTVSVINIETFTEIKRIEVAINLHRLEADAHGVLWVSSRGDNMEIPSRLCWIDTDADVCGGMLDIGVADMAINGDSLYMYSAGYSYITNEWEVNYAIVDVAKKEVVTRNFITDGFEKNIVMPSGIMVNPQNKNIYLTDAINNVHPGKMYCFDSEGKMMWEVPQTGQIPAHFVLLYE